MMTTYFRRVARHCRALLLPLALGLAGCTALGTAPKPMAVYDLGVIEPAPSANAPAPAPAQIALRAPSWLDTSAMQYRLAWDQPLRRRAFADNRWAAPPAEMLARALERSLRHPGAARSTCRLAVELDEFVQVFDSVERSRVELVVRASWQPPRGEAALARTELRVVRDAASADPEGGVSAYRAASEALAAELGAWLKTLDHDGGQGLNTGARCGV